MKKKSLVALALGLTIALFSIANAGYGNGPFGGCADCGQRPGATSDQARKFQTETMDLRQEMMNKRFEAQREMLSATPDAAKVASLQSDIEAIQAKVRDIRGKSGLTGCAGGGECGKRCGDVAKNGMGGCGMGMGGGGGFPCGGPR